MSRRRVLIMGAAGRDFHNFNVVFRDNPDAEVVCFTATQIPDIEGRIYPPKLAGPLYPEGIPIYAESELSDLIKKFNIDDVVFSYSDISHEDLMHKASLVLASGANFNLLSYQSTAIESSKPVISICAVRTGVGKSQTTRRVAAILNERGKKTAVIRHPMPYGNLEEQIWQRFASYEDLDRHKCTIEEREEYEPHIDKGIIVWAGVDYGEILNRAEQEADVILWDGGNNDVPFYKSDCHIVLLDPHRPGHEVTYHPGETNLRLADIVVINKIDTADPKNVDQLRNTVREVNPGAIVVEAASPIFMDEPQQITGKRVLVIEDGPTLTHGEMPYGAGLIAARKWGALETVDPRPWAVGSIKDTFEKYPHIGPLLPAMGYSEKQIKELEETVNKVPCDLVIVATPIDLRRVLKIDKPAIRVRYELQEIGTPSLEDAMKMVGVIG
ncbi:MAG TPA: cyclic 2,3-diphosphoglycerate synthase [Bacillota bacterium]|nr:GTPase [Candidatus Fermentithermobacillaceae bacterium]HOB30399.1 cyclic 2,3-diphosphoglycerate synthase [Bacillota bacterium]HOK64352.1 cyclic 2,3-diphosphoglycerate synthase [Bacillota bacterium]HOL11953.1 cyclic 2,3-diphosphoglycerate synthase [Bacillota bacterium]HOQ03008.1 cyclic 2,3-diphosphoglycerate synthase [Bacillota bacterium]